MKRPASCVWGKFLTERTELLRDLCVSSFPTPWPLCSIFSWHREHREKSEQHIKSISRKGAKAQRDMAGPRAFLGLCGLRHSKAFTQRTQSISVNSVFRLFLLRGLCVQSFPGTENTEKNLNNTSRASRAKALRRKGTPRRFTGLRRLCGRTAATARGAAER